MIKRIFLKNTHVVSLICKQARFRSLSGNSVFFAWVTCLRNIIRWYVCSAWLQSLNLWLKHKKNTEYEFGIPPHIQIRQLILLVFKKQIPAYFYYKYQLYLHAEKQWVNVVYKNERPRCSSIFSRPISEQSHNVLINTHAFVQYMGMLGLPVVESIKYLTCDSDLDEKELFHKKNIFIKATNDNQENLIIRYQRNDGCERYRLIENGCSSIDRPCDILDRLKKKLQTSDYLIQPLLNNTSELDSFSIGGSLVSLRVVTGYERTGPRCISAALILPYKNNIQSTIGICVTTGSAISTREFMLSGWCDVKKIAKQAHAQLPDVATVDWTFALTDKGVKLLSGSYNWTLASHQVNGFCLIPHFEVFKGPCVAEG